MAGEQPHETGQGHGSNCVCLREQEGSRLGGAKQAGKRQPELPADGEKWKREGAAAGGPENHSIPVEGLDDVGVFLLDDVASDLESGRHLARADLEIPVEGHS
jgi:hypothetical protein